MRVWDVLCFILASRSTGIKTEPKADSLKQNKARPGTLGGEAAVTGVSSRSLPWAPGAADGPALQGPGLAVSTAWG